MNFEFEDFDDSYALGQYAAFCTLTFERLGSFPTPVWQPDYRYLSTQRVSMTEADLVEIVAGPLFSDLMRRTAQFFGRAYRETWRWHVARTVVRTATWHARQSKELAEVDLLFCLILAFESGVRFGFEGILDPEEQQFADELAAGRKGTVKTLLRRGASGSTEQEETARIEGQKKLLWTERSAVREIRAEGAESAEFSLRHQARVASDLAQKYRGRLPYGIVSLAFAAGIHAMPEEALVPFLERTMLPQHRDEIEKIGEALRSLLREDVDQEQYIQTLSEGLPFIEGTEVVELAQRASEDRFATCSAEYLVAYLLVSRETVVVPPPEELIETEFALQPLSSLDLINKERFLRWVHRSVELLGSPDQDPLYWVRSPLLRAGLVANPSYNDALAGYDISGKAVFPSSEVYEEYAVALNGNPPKVELAKTNYLKLVVSHEQLGAQIAEGA